MIRPNKWSNDKKSNLHWNKNILEQQMMVIIINLLIYL